MLSRFLLSIGLMSLPAALVFAQDDAKKTHWAFQPVKRPTLPTVANKAWPRNPIDAFILARLEKEKLTANLEADRPTLIRRLKFDLLGLPPTPEEVTAFIKDRDPQAYESPDINLTLMQRGDELHDMINTTGATDEFGYRAEEHRTTIYDLHATILHLLGLDHERLSFYHNGIERRLTDVHGHVVEPILA